MKLEDQVVNLELSKRLKELDIKQESSFYYLNIDGEGEYYIYFMEHMPEEDEYEGDPIAAFTVAELIDLLPCEIGNPHLEIGKHRDGTYGVEYLCMENGYTNDKTLANSAAKMLIYLLENGLIKNAD